MSRSFRQPAYFICCGADPKRGKQITSRRMRRVARYLAHLAAREIIDEIFLDKPQDQKRGSAGSRDKDYGWDFFGDGRHMAHMYESGWVNDGMGNRDRLPERLRPINDHYIKLCRK